MDHQVSAGLVHTGINEKLRLEVKISYGLGDDERMKKDGKQLSSY